MTTINESVINLSREIMLHYEALKISLDLIPSGENGGYVAAFPSGLLAVMVEGKPYAAKTDRPIPLTMREAAQRSRTFKDGTGAHPVVMTRRLYLEEAVAKYTWIASEHRAVLQALSADQPDEYNIRFEAALTDLNLVIKHKRISVADTRLGTIDIIRTETGFQAIGSVNLLPLTDDLRPSDMINWLSDKYLVEY